MVQKGGQGPPRQSVSPGGGSSRGLVMMGPLASGPIRIPARDVGRVYAVARRSSTTLRDLLGLDSEAVPLMVDMGAKSVMRRRGTLTSLSEESSQEGEHENYI